MKKLTFKLPDSSIIIAIVLCASAAYLITSTILKDNVIQYSTLPREISMKVFDETNKDSVVFNLPVISKLRIDSLASVKYQTVPFQRNILFHQNPVFLVWIMLILIMITIAAGALPVFIIQIWQLRAKFDLSTRQLISGILFAVLMAVFLILTNAELPGYYKPPFVINDLHVLLKNGNLLVAIVIATIALIFPSFIVIFLVGIASDNIVLGKILKKNNLLKKDSTLTDEEQLIKQKKDAIETAAGQFEFLNELLRGILQILAIIVVFSVLTSSALRESVKATVEIKYYDIFPTEISYVYGMYFSLFLCVIYIPAYLYLKSRYSRFKEEILNMKEINDEQWTKSVLGIVKFDGSVLDNIKIAMTVLAPLISSFLPSSLHVLK